MVATLGGEHAELLSEVELFRGLDRITLAKLAAHLEPLALTAGEILLRQGDRPDGLYLVSRGTFAIYAAPRSIGLAGDCRQPDPPPASRGCRPPGCAGLHHRHPAGF